MPEIDPRGWLILPSVVLVLVVMAIPVAWLLLRGVSDPTWGLQNFDAITSRPLYMRVALNTLVVSASVTVLCLLLGYPLAYTIAQASPAKRKLLMLIIIVPLWSSALVRNFAWMVLLQDNGLLNQILMQLRLTAEPLSLIYNRVGVLIAMTQVQLPLMVLPLYAVMSRIDPNIARAATTLGAGPVATFFKVYLPLSMSGVAAGCMLVFVISLGFYITPAMLGGRGDLMIAQLIVMQIGDFGNWGMAGAISLSLLIFVVVLFGGLSLLARRQRGWMKR